MRYYQLTDVKPRFYLLGNHLKISRLKVFNKVGHRSSLYHGRYFFSDALKWWIVSLSVIPSEGNDFFLLLLFTWSIKCLSCTSSRLKSLLWRWAFNLVKNSFCLLMSVAKIKEPSCCSIFCLHPQEWKRKHTHKANSFEEGDGFCHHQVACTLISASDSVYYTESQSLQPESDSFTHHRFCPWMGYMSRTGQRDWNHGWTELWQFIHSHGSYGWEDRKPTRNVCFKEDPERLTESQAFELCFL